MKVVTSADFEQEVLKSDKPVLVDFYADWCGPCRQISPVLEQISKENSAVKVIKINIDNSPELAAKFSVRSIPNLLIFRGGDVIAQKIGGDSKTGLTNWINQSLALPASTKLDLAPKAVTLSAGDKQRLRDAFEAAVNNSDKADQETIRTAIKQGLDNGATFKQVEGILSSGQATLDQVVENIKRTKYTIQKGPQG